MAAPQEARPAPDALLDEARREGRGRLKIFLGPYPGVGKTYAMLQAGGERRREGIDVVVGVVETHGRVETEAVTRGLEILPRKRIGYRGRVFAEMDLDALLTRRPKLALVDELAHSNVPGSRHPKRWQDVQELLAAGIDVYTTLNIQHLESLNDIVARISRVRVRETLPDHVLELADEIELVDLPPVDLLQRLHEGKVYVQGQVGRAISHFFSKGNLTAFRELAMRVAAERVDRQMVDYMRAHAIPGPWPAQERLLVCLNEAPAALTLVRTARRRAERQRVPWLAVTVVTPAHDGLPAAAKDRLGEAMRLADSLGAETVTLQAGGDVAGEILALARQRNVTQILIGRPRRRRLFGILRETVARRLAASPDFEVTLVSAEEEHDKEHWIGHRPGSLGFNWRHLCYATLAIALAAAAAHVATRLLPLADLSPIFLIAVLFVAARYGTWPSLYASVVGVVTYNFFFTEPYFTLLVARREDLLTLALFFAASIVAGNLAARLKNQIESMRATARRSANLYDFSRRIAAAVSLDDVLWAAVHHVASTLQCRSLVLLPRDGQLTVSAGYPPEDHLSSKDRGAAEWAWEHGEQAGWGSDTLPAADWLFLPLATARGPVGLLGVAFDGQTTALSTDQSRLIDALAGQVAVAIERTGLAADIEDARLLTETERLRSALLSSVSHDLRTPLVSIIGSATSLAAADGKLSAGDRQQLVQTVLEESERLNRYVQNLLDMTRLGYGALQPKRDWCDLREIVGRALKQTAKLLARHQVALSLAENLPLLHIDAVLIEQVLVNLLDNAAKYAPRGSRVGIEAWVEAGEVRVAVTDEGPGIPEAEREAVFDLFYRVRSTDRQTAGTGLGLSICRGLIEAHGGRIRAESGPQGRGARIVFALPVGGTPLPPEEEGEP